MQLLLPLDSLSRRTASRFITAYQVHLSPHKGFVCAHRVLHRGESCSQYTKRLILEQGWLALPQVRQRFQACKAAHQTLQQQRQVCQNLRSHLSATNSDPDAEQDGKPNEPKRQPSAAPPSSSTASDCSHCSDASCESLECTGLGCDVFDGCGALDGSVLECGGADCGAFDCGALDCGGSACDVGSCG